MIVLKKHIFRNTFYDPKTPGIIIQANLITMDTDQLDRMKLEPISDLSILYENFHEDDLIFENKDLCKYFISDFELKDLVTDVQHSKQSFQFSVDYIKRFMRSLRSYGYFGRGTSSDSEDKRIYDIMNTLTEAETFINDLDSKKK